MEDAVVVLSRGGLFAETISAKQIRSREHLRYYWPLVTVETPKKLVTWVSKSFHKDGRVKAKQHFRVLFAGKGININNIFERAEVKRTSFAKESIEHKLAKNLLTDVLNDKLRNGHELKWTFKDEYNSDCFFSGNLLHEAGQIVTEKYLKTSFGNTYRLDIAIMSKTFSKEPICLGGIEIEKAHRFEGNKALIGMSQAFPLLSVDISGMKVADITRNWAEQILSETSLSRADSRRKTFVYLHRFLYTIYAKMPEWLVKVHRHQYLVFADNVALNKIRDYLITYQKILNIPKKSIALTVVNAKSSQSKVMLANAGNIAGCGWREINPNCCLMISVDRPGFGDVDTTLFHLCLAKILLIYFDTLVGYKFMVGETNEDLSKPVWSLRYKDPRSGKVRQHRLLPKCLAEPKSLVLRSLESLGITCSKRCTVSSTDES